MRIRLAHKIFAAFLLLSIAVILLMILLIQQLTFHIFADHAAERKLVEFSPLVAALGDVYRRQGSIERFDDDSWRHFVAEHSRRGPASIPRRPDIGPRPSRPPLLLLSADRDRIAGPKAHRDDMVARPIEVDGQVVGWLGLKIVRSSSHNLNRTFVDRQTHAFYITGGIAIALAILSAFVFTRWINKPINSLSSGTRAIANRDYSVRLPVRSNDDLGQLALNFNQMTEALQRHEEMRVQWISDISHELRNPLAILRGEVEALQDGIRAPDEHNLSNLHREVMYLSRIVDDMHDLTMADNGTFSYVLRPLNPLECLAQTIQRYRARFEERGIELDHDIDADFTIRADRARLEQLFTNLLENTLRYTAPPGELRITHESGDGLLVVAFEDSAPGVSNDDLERIFDRLYRVDKARSRETGGSGLGLAICRTIVQAHGGTISASHARAGGLKISVSLPMGES